MYDLFSGHVPPLCAPSVGPLCVPPLWAPSVGPLCVPPLCAPSVGQCPNRL